MSWLQNMQDRIRRECEPFNEITIFCFDKYILIKNGKYSTSVEARDFATKKKLEDIEVVNLVRNNKERIEKKLEPLGLNVVKSEKR